MRFFQMCLNTTFSEIVPLSSQRDNNKTQQIQQQQKVSNYKQSLIKWEEVEITRTPTS